MTNQAALWYAKEAARLVGMDEETIRNFGREMYQLFDIYTEKEADDAYRGIIRGNRKRS